MLDFSLSELLLIAVVALVVIGPEDLPKVLKVTLRFFKQIRDMLHEVRQSFDEIVESTGLDDIQKDINKDLNKDARYIIDQNGEYQEIFDVSDLMEAEAKKQQALPPTPKVLTDER